MLVGVPSPGVCGFHEPQPVHEPEPRKQVEAIGVRARSTAVHQWCSSGSVGSSSNSWRRPFSRGENSWLNMRRLRARTAAVAA